MDIPNIKGVGAMKIDFHLHTYYSDGTMSPEEIVQEAKKQGLEAIAITDHNRLDSWPELQELGVTYDIKVVRGVEINCKHQGKQYHLLGYGFDNSEKLIKLIEKAATELEKMNSVLIEKLSLEYPNISIEDYREYTYDRAKGGWKGLHYMMHKGLSKTLFEGFKFYKSHGCDFRDYDFPDAQVLCEAIKEAGGVSVLAHPGEYNKNAAVSEVIDLIKSFKEIGVQGIECYYPTHSDELRAACVTFCRENNLIMTLGSDEHGEFGKQAKRIPQTVGCISNQLENFDIEPFLG